MLHICWTKGVSIYKSSGILLAKYTRITDCVYSSYTHTLICNMCFFAILCKLWVDVLAWKQPVCIEGLLYARDHAQFWGTIFITLRQAGRGACPHTILINSRTRTLKNPPSSEWKWKQIWGLHNCNSWIEGRRNVNDSFSIC